MKYLIIIVVLLGAYWIYQNDSSSESIAETIKLRGFVAAGEVLAKSRALVDYVCNDDVVLRSWGSSSEACFDRVSQFGEVCEQRIFPAHDETITSGQEAKGRMSEYQKCILPG